MTSQTYILQLCNSTETGLKRWWAFLALSELVLKTAKLRENNNFLCVKLNNLDSRQCFVYFYSVVLLCLQLGKTLKYMLKPGCCHTKDKVIPRLSQIEIGQLNIFHTYKPPNLFIREMRYILIWSLLTNNYWKILSCEKFHGMEVERQYGKLQSVLSSFESVESFQRHSW